MSIEFRNVSFSYKEKDIIRNWSFTIPKTGVLCFFGPSGCGKTTIFRLLCGLEKPSKGQMVNLPKKFSVVFQEDRLLPWKTVAENIEITGQNAESVLKLVGLSDVSDEPISSLSGGMARRVAIARAIGYPGDILLLDEPFTGIEEEKIDILAEYILHLAKSIPVLLITHKEEEAKRLNAMTINLSEIDAFPLAKS